MADPTQQPPVPDLQMEVNEDIDAQLDANINSNAAQPDPMNLDGGNDAHPAAANGVVQDAATTLEARIPAKKDATLREFLGKMDDYAPIVRHPHGSEASLCREQSC